MGDETKLTVRVGRGWLEQVKARAQEKDITVSQLVRWLLGRWLREKIELANTYGYKPL